MKTNSLIERAEVWEGLARAMRRAAASRLPATTERRRRAMERLDVKAQEAEDTAAQLRMAAKVLREK